MRNSFPLFLVYLIMILGSVNLTILTKDKKPIIIPNKKLDNTKDKGKRTLMLDSMKEAAAAAAAAAAALAAVMLERFKLKKEIKNLERTLFETKKSFEETEMKEGRYRKGTTQFVKSLQSKLDVLNNLIRTKTSTYEMETTQALERYKEEMHPHLSLKLPPLD